MTTFQDYTDLSTKRQEVVKQLTGITAIVTKSLLDEVSDKTIGRALDQYDPEAKTKGDKPPRGFRFIHEHITEGIAFSKIRALKETAGEGRRSNVISRGGG